MAISTTNLRVLRRLVRHGAATRVARLVERRHPADVAEVMVGLPRAEAACLARALVASGRAAKTFQELPADILEQTLQSLGREELVTLIGSQARDAAESSHFLSHLPEPRRAQVLEELPAERCAALDRLVRYPAGSAGAVMTTRLMSLSQETTVGEAIAEIRLHGRESEALFYLYVVDADLVLTGVVSLRQLLLSPQQIPLRALMVRDPIKVRATDSQEEVAALGSKYDFLSVPVVDEEGRLLGAVTVDSFIDTINAQATEDLYGVAGLNQADRVFSPVAQSVKKRLGWSMLNLLTALGASLVVGFFEGSITKLVALATFMPVVAGLGGNSGTQSLAVVVRALALRELELKRGLRVVWRQLLVGLSVGALAGLATALAVMLWRGDPRLGLVLFMAMVLNMALGAFVGAAVPLVLKLFRQDPALGSGVLVTGITDSFGFLVFLGLGTLILLRVPG